eukprot:8889912-Prorocentrum_lima.AAC.1
MEPDRAADADEAKLRGQRLLLSDHKCRKIVDKSGGGDPRRPLQGYEHGIVRHAPKEGAKGGPHADAPPQPPL